MLQHHKISVILLISLTFSGLSAMHFGQGRLLQSVDPTNCIYPDDGVSDCQMCASGFFPDSDGSPICKPITATGCATSDGFNDACLTCPAGNYLNVKTGNCVPQNVAGCNVYVPGKNYCMDCSAGLIWTAGICNPDNRSNCITYTVKTNRCSVCAANYLVFNGGCKSKFDPKCTYNQVFGGLCTACIAGHFPDPVSRLCIPQNNPLCVTFVDNTNTCAS